MATLKNNRDYATMKAAIESEDDFTNPGKTLWGSTVCYGSGRYNDADMPFVTDADYYIYSYATPIAWRVGDKWFVPAVRYSVTTSKHQGIIRYVTSR